MSHADAESTHRWRSRLAFWLSALTLSLATGCLYDPDDRCDPGQTYNAKATACQRACPINQEPVNDVCQCKVGYEAGPDGVCAPSKICDKDSDCLDPALPHCAPGAPGTKGYCAKRGCSSNAECAPMFTCTTWESGTKYCKRPPTGVGSPCSVQSDCEGKDADYCITFVKLCLVSKCSVEKNDCTVGNFCCASKALGVNVCIPESQACQ